MHWYGDCWATYSFVDAAFNASEDGSNHTAAEMSPSVVTDTVEIIPERVLQANRLSRSHRMMVPVPRSAVYKYWPLPESARPDGPPVEVAEANRLENSSMLESALPPMVRTLPVIGSHRRTSFVSLK